MSTSAPPRPVRPAQARPRRATVPWLAAMVVALGLLAAAATLGQLPPSLRPAAPTAAASAPTGAMVLEAPVDLPDLALRRADGTPFRLGDAQGRFALFYFGYTRCPDVCPLALAHMTGARKLLGPAGGDVDLHFVTVDPERDTPARLAEYGANFEALTALTGTDEQLAAARRAFGVVAERRPLPDRPGDYAVDHTALTFLVDPESRLRAVYPHGTAPAEIAADLSARLGATPIRLREPWARAARAGGNTAAYVRVENRGARGDTLVGAATDLDAAVEVHRMTVEDGVMRMRPASDVAVPAGGSVAMAPGGLHVMVMGLPRDLAPGDAVVLTLRFAGAGEVRARATVRAP